MLLPGNAKAFLDGRPSLSYRLASSASCSALDGRSGASSRAPLGMVSPRSPSPHLATPRGHMHQSNPAQSMLVAPPPLTSATPACVSAVVPGWVQASSGSVVPAYVSRASTSPYTVASAWVAQVPGSTATSSRQTSPVRTVTPQMSSAAAAGASQPSPARSRAPRSVLRPPMESALDALFRSSVDENRSLSRSGDSCGTSRRSSRTITPVDGSRMCPEMERELKEADMEVLAIMATLRQGLDRESSPCRCLAGNGCATMKPPHPVNNKPVIAASSSTSGSLKTNCMRLKAKRGERVSAPSPPPASSVSPASTSAQSSSMSSKTGATAGLRQGGPSPSSSSTAKPSTGSQVSSCRANAVAAASAGGSGGSIRSRILRLEGWQQKSGQEETPPEIFPHDLLEGLEEGSNNVGLEGRQWKSDKEQVSLEKFPHDLLDGLEEDVGPEGICPWRLHDLGASHAKDDAELAEEECVKTLDLDGALAKEDVEGAGASCDLVKNVAGAPRSMDSAKKVKESIVDSHGAGDLAGESTPPTKECYRHLRARGSGTTPQDTDSPADAGVGSTSASSPEQTSQTEAHHHLKDLWDFVVQGPPVKDKEEPDDDQKSQSCFPSNALELLVARGVACRCIRGQRVDANVPNQDDFLLAVRKPVKQGHVGLYGVFDGHGPTGHRCAAFARSFLAECIFSDHDIFSKPKAVLKRAFAQTQEALLEQPFNVQVSGTTATLTLIIDSRRSTGTARMYVAHIGDSRAVLASQKEEGEVILTTLTKEHRPDDPEEEMRIKLHGGEVRRTNNGAGAGRVFAPGRNHPALSTTRSLGAAAAAECGVLHEPEITSHRLRPGNDLLLVLGSDGLFEFCSSRDVVMPLLERGVSGKTLEDLCALSRERWAANSYNQTFDDTTVVAVSLLSHFG